MDLFPHADACKASHARDWLSQLPSCRSFTLSSLRIVSSFHEIAFATLIRLKDGHGHRRGGAEVPRGRVVTPYWPHAMIKWATANLMSDSALDGFSSAEIKLLIEGAQAKTAGAQ